MMEDEEKPITDASNVTADTFSHASSSQIENLDATFTCENIEKSDELVNAINNLIMNDDGYELNTVKASDTQDNLMRKIDTVNHTSNGILNQKIFSFRTIGEVSFLSLPTNPWIRLTPQTLLTPEVKEIFVDTMSGNT